MTYAPAFRHAPALARQVNKTLKYLVHSDNDIDPDIGRWIDERIRVNRAIKHDGSHFTKYLDSLFPEKEEVWLHALPFPHLSPNSSAFHDRTCSPQGHEKGGFELSLTADVDYLRKVQPPASLRTPAHHPHSPRTPRTPRRTCI